jgi:hypothetical protein
VALLDETVKNIDAVGIRSRDQQAKANGRHIAIVSGVEFGVGRRDYSTRSLAFACPRVCHCMFSGASEPPRFSGTMWSTTYPGQRPVTDPVDGHGCNSWKACRALELRRIRPLDVRSHVTQ